MLKIGKKYCREGHVMDPTWDVCPVCIAPIRGWLVWLDSGIPRAVFNIHEGRMLIGSGADCEVRLQAPGIKRHHAQITASVDGSTLMRLADIGGMTVNNSAVTSTAIIDGDVITLGEQEFKFKCL